MDTSQLDEQTRAAEHAREAPEFVQDLHCPKCAYCLFGVAGARCPECGYELEGLRRAESSIPWVHRRRIGSCRAYLQTVFWVAYRPRQFFEEIARDVDYVEARKFQAVTVGLATILALVANLGIALAMQTWAETKIQQFETRSSLITWNLLYLQSNVDIWPVVMLGLCFGLWVLAATGVPSYFFHPRSASIRFQNRAISLSYYASATTSCIGIAYGLAALTAYVSVKSPRDMPLTLAVATGVVAAICVIPWWVTLVRLMRAAFPGLPLRALVLGVTLVPIWSLLAFFLLFGLPVAVLMILVALRSLV